VSAQERPRQTARFALAAVVCLVTGLLGGLFAAVAMRSEPEPEVVRFVPPREAPPTFRLRDQDGRWTTPADARGDVLLVTFLYSTCRNLCPRQTQEIKDAVVKAGHGVQVYGISVDPAGDTPERARSFLKRYGLAGGPVRFLVGSRRELSPVWASYGIVPIGAAPEEAAAAAAAYRRQRGQSGATADRAECAPGSAASRADSERPGRRDEEAAPHGGGYGGSAGYGEGAVGGSANAGAAGPARECRRVEPEPPDAALEPYPDIRDMRYRGRSRHGPVDFEHSAYVLVIDKHGRQRVGFPFEHLDRDLLTRDIRILRREP
jgi:cytochrome oxidase Cu insertion factor (SCO1/SenC/PrrC family)